jgi:hypothetical protein
VKLLNKLDGEHIVKDTSSDNTSLELKPDDVHVIDEMKVIGEAIGEKISELEWWQSIDRNIDKDDIDLKPLKKPDPIDVSNISPTKTIMRENILIKPLKDLSLIDLKNDTAYDRLQLIGSLKGFFKSMNRYKVQPDHKTFMLLIQVKFKSFILIESYESFLTLLVEEFTK